MALLDVTQTIGVTDGVCNNSLECQPLSIVADIRCQAEGRRFQHLLSFVVYAVLWFSLISEFQRYFDVSIGTGDRLGIGCHD